MKVVKTTINISVKVLASGLTALMLMVGSFAFAQERENVGNNDLGEAAREYIEWDVNADNQLDQDEFNSFINDTGLYGNLDANEDGAYDDAEITDGFFSDADGDDDGYLDNNEYDKNLSILKRDYDDNVENTSTFEAWDANNDNFLDANELKKGFIDRETYRGWDTDKDGVYSKEEFNTGLFNAYDANGDGFVNEEEYSERRSSLKTSE